MRMYINISKW